MKRSGHGGGKALSLPLSSIAQSREEDCSSVAETRSRTSSCSYDNRSQSTCYSSSDSEGSIDKEEIFKRVQKLKDAGMWYEDRMWKLAEPPRKKTAWDYMLDEITKTSELFKERRKQKELARAKISEELAINSHFQAIKRQKTENRKKMEVSKRISEMIFEFWNLQYEKTKMQSRNPSIFLLSGAPQKEFHPNAIKFNLPESEKPINFTSPTNRLGVNGDNKSSNFGDKHMDISFNAANETPDQDPGNIEHKSIDNLPVGYLNSTTIDGKKVDSSPQTYCDAFATTEESDNAKSDSIDGSTEESDSDESYSIDGSATTDESDSNESDFLDGSATTDESDSNESDSIDGSATTDEGDSDESDSIDGSATTEESDSDESDSIDGSATAEESGSESRDECDELSDTEESKLTYDDEDSREEDFDANDVIEIENHLASFNPDLMEMDEPMCASTGEESVQPNGCAFSTIVVRTKVSCLLKGSLREYQQVGVDWLANLYWSQSNGILADEAGLGKTCQVIAFLAYLATDEKVENWGPHLIVAPRFCVVSWELEFKKWCPALKLLIYIGSQEEREAKRQGWMNRNSFHVCITSYNIACDEMEHFNKKQWTYVILDEADYIEDFRSKRWKSFLRFRSNRRLLLTRSPLPKTTKELWSIMLFLFPGFLKNYPNHKTWYSATDEGSSGTEGNKVEKMEKGLLKIVLRRLRCEVHGQLPEIKEHIIRCPLSNHQRYLYWKCIEDARAKKLIQNGSLLEIMRILKQLRGISNHANYYDSRQPKSPLLDSGIPCIFPLMVWDLLDQKKWIIPTVSMFETTEADYKGGSRDEIGISNGDNDFHKPTENDAKWSGREKNWEAPGFSIAEKIVKLERNMKKRAVQKKSKTSRPLLPVLAEPINLFTFWSKSVDTGVRAYNSNTSTPLKESTNITRDNKRPDASTTFHTVQAPPGKKASIPEEMAKASVVPLNESNCFKPLFENQTKYICSNDNNKAFQVPEIEERCLRNRRELVLKLKALKRVKGYGAGTLMMCDVFKDIPSMRYFGRRRRRLRIQPLYQLEDLNFEKHAYFPLGYAEAKLAMYLKGCPLDSSIRNHPHILWRMTNCLMNLTWTVEEQLKMFIDIIKIVLIYVPVVSVKNAHLNFWRPNSTRYFQQEQMDLALEKELREPAQNLYPIFSKMILSCPDQVTLAEDCGKLKTLKKLLLTLKTVGRRVVIFTEMDEMLILLEYFLKKLNLSYLRLDATAIVEDRRRMVECFNACQEIFCCLMSTRTGRAGGNITGADTVIFYGSDWNPTIGTQANDRCLLIGPTKEHVDVYRLVSEHTFEEIAPKNFSQEYLFKQFVTDDLHNVCVKKSAVSDLFNTDWLKSDFTSTSSSGVDTSEEKEEIRRAMNEEKTLLIYFEDILQGVEDKIDWRAALSVQSEANEFLKEFDEHFDIDFLRDVEVTLPKAEKDIRIVSKIAPLHNFAVRTIKSCFEDWPTEMQNNKKTMEAIRKMNWELDFVENELLDFQRRSKIQKLIMNYENAVAHLPKIGTENSVRVTPVPGVDDFYVDPCLGYLYNREIAPKSESVPSAPATKLVPRVSKYHLLLKNTLNEAGTSSTQGPLLHAGPSSFPTMSAVNDQSENPAMKRDRKIKTRENFLEKLKKLQQLTGAEEGVPVAVCPKTKPLRAINFRSTRCLTIGVENPGPWKPGTPGRDIFGACSCIYCLSD